MALPAAVQMQIVLDNLEKQGRELCMEHEKRLSHLSDMARIIGQSVMDGQPEQHPAKDVLADIKGQLQLLYPKGDYMHRQAHPAHQGRLQTALRSLHLYDTVAFAGYLTACLGEQAGLSLADLLPATAPAGGRVAYMESRYTDEAFALLPDGYLPLSPMQDVREVCEAVVSGQSEYCLLPFEEAEGVYLRSIAALIRHYDMKVCLTLRLFGQSREGEMRYALLSRHFRIPPDPPDGQRYFRCRFSQDAQHPISGVLGAAQAFGCPLQSITSAAPALPGADTAFEAVFGAESEAGVRCLLVYLSLFAAGFVPVGYYDTI